MLSKSYLKSVSQANLIGKLTIEYVLLVICLWLNFWTTLYKCCFFKVALPVERVGCCIFNG